MQRNCEVCRESFDAKRASARYCSSSCRGNASKVRKRTGTVVELADKVAQPATTGTEATAQRELEKAGKLDTTGGQQVLLLARRLDHSTADTSSGVAALSKELHRMMAVVLADVDDEPDALDLAQGKVVQMRSTRRRA